MVATRQSDAEASTPRKSSRLHSSTNQAFDATPIAQIEEDDGRPGRRSSKRQPPSAAVATPSERTQEPRPKRMCTARRLNAVELSSSSSSESDESPAPVSTRRRNGKDAKFSTPHKQKRQKKSDTLSVDAKQRQTKEEEEEEDDGVMCTTSPLLPSPLAKKKLPFMSPTDAALQTTTPTATPLHGNSPDVFTPTQYIPSPASNGKLPSSFPFTAFHQGLSMQAGTASLSQQNNNIKNNGLLLLPGAVAAVSPPLMATTMTMQQEQGPLLPPPPDSTCSVGALKTLPKRMHETVALPARLPPLAAECDLNPVQKAVIEYAAKMKLDAAEVWRQAGKIALEHTATTLLSTLGRMNQSFSSSASICAQPPPPQQQRQSPPQHTFKATAGVSYIVRSESKQEEVFDQVPLPHMVYRPPPPLSSEALLLQDSPEIKAALEILENQTTTATTMHLRDENAMKRYLLEPALRAAIVEAAGGSAVQLAGAQDVAQILEDKKFVCLHYQLANFGGKIRLTPCATKKHPEKSKSTTEEDVEEEELEEGEVRQEENGAPSSSSCSSCLDAVSDLLTASNLQLGILIRKGVGGTYPLRTAAKKLQAQGLLGVLMDKTLPTVPLSAPSSSFTPAENGITQPQPPPPTTTTPTETATPVVENEENEEATAGVVAVASLPHEDEEDAAAKRLNLYTLSCRFEMYVEETAWTGLSESSQLVLHSIVHHLEQRMQRYLSERNWKMLYSAISGRLEEVLTSSLMDDDDILSTPLAATLLPLFALAQEEEEADEEALLPEKAMMDFSTALVLSAASLVSLEAASFSFTSTAAATAVHIPWPLYFISTRDSFTHHLIPVETLLHSADGLKTIKKTEWFFQKDQVPADYHAVLQRCAGIATTSGALPPPLSSSISLTTTSAPGFESEQAEVAEVMATMVHALEQMNNQQQQLFASPSSESTQQEKKGAKLNIQEKTITASKNTFFLLPVGVTTYTESFTSEQLADIEKRCDVLDASARAGHLPPACTHSTFGKGGGLKRTKYFFGARYLWTKEQLSAPDAHIAKGIRVDVPVAPQWVHTVVEAPLVESQVLPQNFINSVALNMYHDGSEGIQVHYDDSARFQQPIYSLRLFSDSRLSFGTQLYGYTNGSFFIPMPRGCVTVMESGSYAANGVKHCVRPGDMSGKSAGMILRHMNPNALSAAHTHILEETTDWMQCLSLSAVSLRAETVAAAAALLNADRLGGKLSKIQRQITSVMDKMLRSVECTALLEARRARSLTTSVASVMSSLVRRVELAEALGVDLMIEADEGVFGVVEGLVRYCEVLHQAPPAQQKQDKKEQQTKKKNKLFVAAASKDLPPTAAFEVALVMRKMVQAVEMMAGGHHEKKKKKII